MMKLVSYRQDAGALHYQTGLPLDLRDMATGAEVRLQASKDAYEPLRELKDGLTKEVENFRNSINKKVKESSLLKKVRAITPFTGMGFFPVMIAGATMACPAATIVGLLVTAGSVALHEYSIRRGQAINKDYKAAEADYKAAEMNLGRLSRECQAIENGIALQEKECRRLKVTEEQARAEVKDMAENLGTPAFSGQSDVDEGEGYIAIDGVKMPKNQVVHVACS